MAFSPNNVQRELANRKILEELQIKKQLLLKQGAANNLAATTTSILPPLTNTSTTLPISGPPVGLIAEAHNLSAQRAALHSAHIQSFGFFVTQDSLFGNLILPVLPRFDK